MSVPAAPRGRLGWLEHRDGGVSHERDVSWGPSRESLEASNRILDIFPWGALRGFRGVSCADETAPHQLLCTRWIGRGWMGWRGPALGRRSGDGGGERGVLRSEGDLEIWRWQPERGRLCCFLSTPSCALAEFVRMMSR